jgi:tRNA pseudouridine55 synthase
LYDKTDIQKSLSVYARNTQAGVGLKATNGFLLINKPAGPSSFEIIKKVRSIFSCRQVGHAGTLDPDADGLLICAVGSATRLIEYLSTDPKTYEFTAKFGEETDTLDASGKVVRSSATFPEKEQLERVIPEFIGEQQQVPPVYSAIKINGERAYILARKGKKPEIKPRDITIYSLILRKYDRSGKTATFIVKCSGGTYVRSLTRDIAESVSSYAHTTAIHRTQCGRFTLEEAFSLHNLTQNIQFLLRPSEVFTDLPRIEASDEMKKMVSNGRDIEISDPVITGNTVIMYYKKELIAVLEKVVGRSYHPSKVFLSEESNNQ